MSWKRWRYALLPIGWVTVRVTGTVCASVPLVPVTVTVVVPVVAVADAANVTVALVPVVDGGLNVAVTPDGSGAAAKLTLPANPPVRAMVMVLAALAPCSTLTATGA